VILATACGGASDGDVNGVDDGSGGFLASGGGSGTLASAQTDGSTRSPDATSVGAGGSGGAAGADAGQRDSGRAETGGAGSGGAQGKIFDQCRFHFGTIDGNAKSISGLAREVDMFTTGWIGQKDTFDMKYVCDEIKPGAPLAGKVPALVSYIIAFTARRDQGLEDCNVVGTTNLCKYGATYMRAHLEDRIVPQYAMYAKGFADNCGTTQPIIWLMEPDFYQYVVGGDANAYTAKEAGQIMGRFVATVRQYLPNAIFSLDISPWIPKNGADWYPNFNMSDFTFINTSGGSTDAGSTKIRATDSMTWAGVHQVTGKPILADTGYGAAGTSGGHDAAWDLPANINARITDGVVSITQYNPNSSWGNTIPGIRPQLSSVPCY
jgi:hypothetical protein